jgi:hypothetical protein
MSAGLCIGAFPAPPPSGGLNQPFLLSTADSILVTAASSQPNEVLTCTFQFYDATMSLWFQDQIIITPDPVGSRVVISKTYRVYDNQQISMAQNHSIYLTDLSIVCKVATTRGQTFVRVNLNRQGRGTFPTQCVILSDYVSQTVTACLRNSRHFTSIEGPGNITVLQPASPGVGLDINISMPINTRWKILSFRAQFVTSAQVANRTTTLQVNQNFNIGTYPANFTQAASTTELYTWGPGLGNLQVLTNTAASIPVGIIIAQIGGGNSIRTTTAGIQTADQWSIINVLVEEWLEQV